MPQGDEAAFRQWYAEQSKKYDLNPDPDDPRQFYDYRAAFRAGAQPDASKHWPSEFKRPGHQNEIVGGFNTRTGERVIGTPRANERDLVRMGWDAASAKRLAAMPEPQDLDAIAKKYGGTVTSDEADALAKKYGGTVEGGGGLQIPQGTAPAEAIKQMKAYNEEQGLTTQAQSPSWLDTGLTFGKNLAGAVGELAVGIPSSLYALATHPVNTMTGLAQAQWQELQKAKQAASEGRYSEMYGHGMAGALPLVGPAAAEVGEQIGSGDVSKGLARGVVLTGSAVLPSVVKGAAKTTAAATRATGISEPLATIAEQSAAKRFARAVSPPGTSATNIRFGKMAADVAPDVLREEGMGAMTRGGFARKVGAKLYEAEDALDAAADARNAGRAYQSQPIINALMEKRKALTAEAVPASDLATHEPIGRDVVPKDNAARVAQIDAAIDNLRELGPIVRYEAIKRIRMAFDQPARTKYTQVVGPDFLKKMGEASGAADVTGVLREHLGYMDPKTAAANAPYAMWRKLDDVMTAAEDLERVKPAVGRSMMSRLTGAVVGAGAGGGYGAAIGAVLAPMVEKALGGPITTRIATARALTQFADAMKRGHVETATSAWKRLRALSVMGQAKSKEPE